MKKEKIKTSLDAFISRLDSIQMTADVADDHKVASEKLHRCAKDIVVFLNSNGYPSDAREVEAVMMHIEVTYGVPQIFRIKNDIDCYRTKLTVLRDALDEPTHSSVEQVTESSEPVQRIGNSLDMPEKITLKWFMEHTPISFWPWVLGIIGMLFVAGIYVGQLSFVKELIGRGTQETVLAEHLNTKRIVYTNVVQTGFIKSVAGPYVDVYYLNPFTGTPELTLIQATNGPDPAMAFEIFEQRPDGFRLSHFRHSDADTNGMIWKASGIRSVEE
ncbi:MAG TPA: hypothetical protein PLJ22_02930 [Kiritimatiellia bacterium]|nr:hypothetical protein [Kiritimatiellia bacterium]